MSEFELHLKDRGLKRWHRCWSTGPLPDTPKEEHVVFPLFAPGGRYIGHQRYFWRRPKLRSNDEQGRYITTFLPEYKLSGFYGLDNCFGYGPLFVTEGIWDSLRAGNCYVDCVALLSNSPSKQLRRYLKLMCPNRPIIALIDRDENKAGERLANMFDGAYAPADGYEDFNAMPHDVCMACISKILGDVRNGKYR